MNPYFVLIFLLSATEAFYLAFTPALFATKTLGDAIARYMFDRPRFQKPHDNVEALWLDYLLRRCRDKKTDDSAGRYAEIRAMATGLVGHQKTTREGTSDLGHYDAILRELCRLALDRGTKYPGFWVSWASYIDNYPGPGGKRSNPKGDLLSAACYFGCLSLVKDLLAEGAVPERDQGHSIPTTNTLFASPAYLAAWAGQAEVLQLVLESLPNLPVNAPGMGPSCRRVKDLQLDALVGAACRGDINMVKLVMCSARVRVPGSLLIVGYEPGSIPRASREWGCIRCAMAWTSFPEIYSYLDSFLAPGQLKKSEEELENYWLAARAASGDVVMVRHLLDIGADAADRSGRQGPALAHAVRGCHEDVVDLLLERGADPSHRGRYRLGTPLTAAAKAGSVVMLRKLLDAGAKFLKNDSYTLRHAIMKEHTAMAELLLSWGIGTERGRGMFLVQAQKAGMDSMVDLLKSWGAKEMGAKLPGRQ